MGAGRLGADSEAFWHVWQVALRYLRGGKVRGACLWGAEKNETSVKAGVPEFLRPCPHRAMPGQLHF